MATPVSIKEHYTKEIAPALQKELGIKNIHAVPALKTVKINIGLGPLVAAKKDYSDVLENIASITGQKPVVNKARKSISNFKIREGMPVGASVTLRGKTMYDFMTKLIHVTFPRIRDFRGFSAKAFDGNGNYSVGIKENTVFPEINPDAVDKIHGLQITIVTTATDDEQGYKLLKAMGFPFQPLPQKKSEQS
ncbi:MAG: 50S ribosomal protein L5 [Candidatus Gracilibacteria bacterium]|nr:50S ribosomal protein L5 [Candidatus Peregrinibacteria bacterium]HMR00909.1 50S ribosomal protein L5 [Candidatus Gracilibacteria bacterium]